MVRRSHFVVISDTNGGMSTYPFKQWLRDNPDENPPGMHPDRNTSHTLLRRLKTLGWKLHFTQSQVFVIRPDPLGSTSYADELIDEEDGEGSEGPPQGNNDASEITFGLERDLQSALRSDIKQLEAGLRIIDGGKERSTEAGRIDIVAEDNDGNLVVVELKAGPANSGVITQVLAYMSSIADSDRRSVRGIIVAGGFSDRIVRAAKAVPNLALRKYTFQFSFDTLD